jgi:hypothetical protein
MRRRAGAWGRRRAAAIVQKLPGKPAGGPVPGFNHDGGAGDPSMKGFLPD